MFIAEDADHHHVYLGTEIQGQVHRDGHENPTEHLRCPVCGRAVSYWPSTRDQPFAYFFHQDGSPDCFDAESFSAEHRLATEVAVKVLYNRVREVTGKPVDIDIERWIGTTPNFVIADIRISSPLQIAAEIYYRTERLRLRRLKTVFENDYSVYMVFHSNGKHNIDTIERHIHNLAPLSVGRFDPDSFELALGDLFTEEQISLTGCGRDEVPNYILR